MMKTMGEWLVVMRTLTIFSGFSTEQKNKKISTVEERKRRKHKIKAILEVLLIDIHRRDVLKVVVGSETSVNKGYKK